MELSALIDKITNYEGEVKTKPKDQNKPLDEYSGKTPKQLKAILYSMLAARRVEREEKLLLRKGYNRFFIGCGGKELIDVCLADDLEPKDPFLGYYRNKAFDIHRGCELWEKMLEAIGDSRSQTGGVQIPAHPSYPQFAVLPHSSSTGSHAMEAAGLGAAIKSPVGVSEQSEYPGGAYKQDAIVTCSIGEGSTSSTEFARAVFYSVFNKTRNLWAIYNCGWAISVSVEEQYPDGDPTVQFTGLEKYGLKIMHFDGTDIKETLANVKEAIEYLRADKGPVLANIKTTREGSHSGSDDQSFYMDPVELDWHTYNDCILKTCNTLIEDGIITSKEIAKIWDDLDKEISELSAKAVSTFVPKTLEGIAGKVYTYDFEKCKETWAKYRTAMKADRVEKYKEYHEKKYFNSPEIPEKTGPMTMRFAINYTLFDILTMSEDALLFGEDVADFSGHMIQEKEKQAKLKGKGGVFLVSKNLQNEFGNDRCFNAPLDECGIIGRAIGECYVGRRPLPEVQFLDYLSPAYQIFKDRFCTTYQRSNGQWKMPAVLRVTYGGYKQGAGAFWHSEGNLGTWMNIPGLLVVIPSNARDAAGLLRTAWACDDPVLFCESVALYNRRDWDGLPIEDSIDDIDELIPFGKAKVYNEDAQDIAIITFGVHVQMSRKAAELVKEKGINCQIVDLRTVKPLDNDAILKAAKDCGKVMIITEDRFHGGCSGTISSVITEGDGLFDLEAPIKHVVPIDARVAYGVDGDNACLPTVDKIVTAIEDLHNNY